ncbi:MAG TPA: hypothetical protein VJA21_01320 [Verrucomicrobiae bacterium]
MKTFKPNTQLGRLQKHFLTHPKEWTPMLKLIEVSWSPVIHSKVAELRRGGMWIDNECLGYRQNPNQRRESFYRYIPDLDIAIDGKFDVVFVDAVGQDFNQKVMSACLDPFLKLDGVLIFHTMDKQALAKMGRFNLIGNLLINWEPSGDQSSLFFYALDILSLPARLNYGEIFNEKGDFLLAVEAWLPQAHRRLLVRENGAPEGWSHAPLDIFERTFVLQPTYRN